MRLMAVACALLVASAAFAQERPSFDCARVTSVVERAICRNAALARADRTLAEAYTALHVRLAGPAKEHLANDQARWIANRDRACGAVGDEIEDCLTMRYDARSALLAFLTAGDYPFIGEQATIRTGKVKRIDFRIDASYPQFDARPPDFTAVNRSFVEQAEKAGKEAVPVAGKIGDELEQEWSYEQNFALYRASRRAIAVAIYYRAYTGGAHGYIATRCSLVDIGTGKFLDLEQVFAPGDQWLKRMVELVRNDLNEQFVDRPGDERALTPDNLARLLSQSHRYLFRDDNVLEIIFNPHEVGPYAAGPYSVEISYDDLRSIIRADGPLGR